MKLGIIAAMAISTLAACGGSGGGSGGGTATVSGTVGGITLSSIAETTSVALNGASCQNPSQFGAALSIYMSAASGVCSSLENATSSPTANGLSISIFRSGTSQQAAIGPGTYSVSVTSTPAMYAYFGPSASSSCTSGGFLATSGSVTITSVTNGAAAGTFNLTFVDSMGAAAGTLTGSFTASDCAVTINCSRDGGSC